MIMELVKPPVELIHYFPANFKVYEYNAPTSTAQSVTLESIKDWLLAKENGSFVFQCLFCLQEMDFKTVFWSGDICINRSHLFTKKHIKKISKFPSVGILFNSTKKFVMCSEVCFKSDSLIDQMKFVHRRAEAILKNPSILNKVFCHEYMFFTFDRGLCKLVEFDSQGDIIQFMKEEVRPLFRFFCLFCLKSFATFTGVVKHLTSSRHMNRKAGNKSAILSIRDYNIFMVLSFDKLSSFMHLKHPKSFLEEIIIASEGFVYISSCISKDDKKNINCSEIETKFEPICLPNNTKIDNNSIRIRIPFKCDESNSENSLVRSNVTYEKSFTIYELCDESIRSNAQEDLINSLLRTGCGIYCTRCSAAIKTLEEFHCHLLSETHSSRVRKNELIGLMCYICKLFFIELKGDTQTHIHNSGPNKKILKLFSARTEAIAYDTPLCKFIKSFYLSSKLEPGESMFICLNCLDLSAMKLSNLQQHENTKNNHSDAVNYICVYCKFCKVVYIEIGSQSDPIFFFKEHLVSHSELNTSLIIEASSLNTVSEHTEHFSLVVNHNKIGFGMNSKSSKVIKVAASYYFSQLANPGVCQKEFQTVENWTQESFLKYINHYLPQKELIFNFVCLKCKESSNLSTAAEHLFTKCADVTTNFIKFCDVCNQLIFGFKMEDIQHHFFQRDHIYKLFAKKGLPLADVYHLINSTTLDICSAIFPSESEFLNIIEQNLADTKRLFKEKENYFEKIIKDSCELLAQDFPCASCEFYGSHPAGLALQTSDIDICFNVGESNFNKISDLLRSSVTFKVLVDLPNAKKPIFRVIHQATGFNCDICLSLIWETHFSKLVKFFIDFDARIHWLLVAVRYWCIKMKLRNPQTLSSSAITWLVLFYLMQPHVRIIPNISYIFDAWGGRENIMKKDIKINWTDSLGGAQKTKLDLLLGFFHYYSLLNFSKCRLCPFSGLVLPSDQSYSHPWYLIDPFDNKNILQNFSDDACKKFQMFCYMSLHMPWRYAH